MATQATSPAIAGLWASDPEDLPFARGVVIRTFLLQREHGNALIYNTATLADGLDQIRERGGAERQYLNHEHESIFGSDAPAHALGARPIVHADDAARVRDRGWDAHLTFTRRHTLDDDLEVIPIPGHTPGASAYLWDNGAERLLFTGDSLMLGGEAGSRWTAAVLDSSDRAAYVRSLELLRTVEFDVLVPWAAPASGGWFARVDTAERLAQLDAVIARLRAGESA